jgi:hypothetical protein
MPHSREGRSALERPPGVVFYRSVTGPGCAEIGHSVQGRVWPKEAEWQLVEQGELASCRSRRLCRSAGIDPKPSWPDHGLHAREIALRPPRNVAPFPGGAVQAGGLFEDVKQRLRSFQIGRPEPFDEPVIDGLKQRLRVGGAALIPQQLC